MRGDLIPFIALWTSLILHSGARRHGVLERGSVLTYHSYAVGIPCRKRTEPSPLLFRKSRLLTREDHAVTLLCVNAAQLRLNFPGISKGP